MSKDKDGRTWVKVKEAHFLWAAGNSVFKPGMPLGNSWELVLEDGRVISYPVRYKKQQGYIKRGWYHRRNHEDALPAPKRVLMEPKSTLKRVDNKY